MFDTTHHHQPEMRPFSHDGHRSTRKTLWAIVSLVCGVLNAPPLSAQVPIEFKGHQEVVYDAKFLPDGNSLVTASFDQTVKLWDVATQSTLRTMEGHTGIVLTVDVSPDGKLIASGSSDRTIRLWDVPDSDPISTRQAHDHAVKAMATSKDGTLTATADHQGLIRIWSTAPDTASPKEEAATDQKPLRQIATGRPIARLAWRNDNKQIAAACVDGSLVAANLAADGETETIHLGAHAGEVTGVTFTPNNRYILSAGADGYVRRWPTALPNTVTFDALPKAATSIVIHPNGSLIAVTSDDGSAKILKRADGAVVHTLDGHTGRIIGVAFNRAGTQLATIGADQIVRVFGVSDGKMLTASAAAKSPLTSVMFSVDGKDAIVGTERGDVYAYALTEAARFRSLSKRPKAVRAITTTSDGSRLVFAGDDKQLWIRDSVTGKTERSTAFEAGITALAIPSNNTVIAAGLATGAIVIVDAKTLKQTELLVANASPVNRIAFNTSGTQLVSSTADGAARLWDLKATAVAQTFRTDGSKIADVAFQNDNKSIVMAVSDGKVLVETVAAQIVHRADDGRINDISMSSNGSQYATAGADGTVKLWNASNSTPTRSFSGFEGPALCVSLSPDNRQVAAGGSDKTVRTWNVGNASGHFRLNVPSIPRRVGYSPDSTKLVVALTDNTLHCFDPTPLNPQPAEPPGRDASQVLRGHTAPVGDLTWASDNKTLRTCSDDKTLRTWTVASPKEKARLSGHSLQVYSVVFSPDGETIASASADKTVRLWNVETGKVIKTLATFPAAIYSLDFSSDGKQIAIAGADNSVRILNVNDGQTIREFDGPEHAVYTVAFSPDDSRIAAAGMGVGSERRVYLWSRDSSQPTATLQGHNDDIYRTEFNSSGNRLMSIGYSGSLRIWDAESGKPLFEQNSGIVSYSGTFSPDASKIVITSNDRTARLITLPASAR